MSQPQNYQGDSNRLASEVKADIDKLLAHRDDEVSIIDLVDWLIEYGYFIGSSDICLDSEKDMLVIGLRIDGVLQDSFKLPKTLHAKIITRIKILAGMRTDLSQVAEEGKFKVNLITAQEKFDVHVLITPTPSQSEEGAVLKLLRSS